MVLSNTVDSIYLCVLSLITTRVDIIWCRDQDGGNSTETNLFSCGLSSSFNKDPKQGKGSHGEGRTHRNGYRIAKQHHWATCTEEIYSTGTWRENRTTPWRTDEDEIQDEILELSSQRSRFIHLTLFDKKSTQPPSPATHQEFPQVVEQWLSTRAK